MGRSGFRIKYRPRKPKGIPRAAKACLTRLELNVVRPREPRFEASKVKRQTVAPFARQAIKATGSRQSCPLIGYFRFCEP
jgi:hypothetical protein